MKRVSSTALAVSVVVILAGALAATSHTSVWSPVRQGVADPAGLLVTVTSSFGLCLAIAAALSFARQKERRQAFAASLPTSIVVAVLLSLFIISKTDLQPGVTVTGDQQVETGPTRVGDRLESDWRGPAVRRGGREDDLEALIPRSSFAVMLRRTVAMLAFMGLGALLLGRGRARRSRDDGPPEPFGRADRTTVHGSIVTTIEAMLNDPDPRTAIIGAYARLLEELEANGASRRAYEGPNEHVVRVLATLDARPAALRKLVRLFEIARFSDRSLTAAHRKEALAALRAIAQDLAAPPVAAVARSWRS